MSSLDFDFDLDSRMSRLERKWREAYDAGKVARADYETLAASAKANASLLDLARERMARIEALKARIIEEMDRLEDGTAGKG
ncbi:MAG TPA: hypothetical protein VNW26_08035 [Steroidobacteraceae bacterium]|nr:hypothetical protein [Steroidobacteraceae bacterium]